MKAKEVSLVKESFLKIVPIADQTGVLFYARLFELDPSLRALFRGDITEDSRKLMTMIAMAVRSLERLDTLVPVIRDLGARHSAYSATEEHYATVGVALLWTLEKGLGPAFTTEVRDAWTSAYLLLANTMIEAQRGLRLAA